MEKEYDFSIKEALMFSHKMSQLSKAMWKCVEKDWQNWIKPYGLNINEHHILWIAFHLEGASISDISNFGIMHVSTAFNFSKKLEEQGLLTFSKKETDKRNTYIQLTEKGKDLLLKTLDTYDPVHNGIFSGSLKLRDLYGKFPSFDDMMSIIRHVYGDEYMKSFDKSIKTIEKEFDEVDGKLVPKQKAITT